MSEWKPGDPVSREQLDEWLDAARGGYEIEELSAAFDLVKNPENWKLHIDTVIPVDMDPAEMARVIGTAITWYTGSVADIWREADGLHVQAAGYDVDIGS